MFSSIWKEYTEPLKKIYSHDLVSRVKSSGRIFRLVQPNGFFLIIFFPARYSPIIQTRSITIGDPISEKFPRLYQLTRLMKKTKIQWVVRMPIALDEDRLQPVDLRKAHRLARGPLTKLKMTNRLFRARHRSMRRSPSWNRNGRTFPTINQRRRENRHRATTRSIPAWRALWWCRPLLYSIFRLYLILTDTSTTHQRVLSFPCFHSWCRINSPICALLILKCAPPPHLV